MDFALSEDQQMIFDTARQFGADRIAPFARQWENEGAIPREVLEEAAALGFAAIYVPEDQGGTGLTRLDATLVFEALSMACPSVAGFLTIHNMCTNMVALYGTDALKAMWMPQLLSMEKICSYCLTEPGSGSDAAALRTRAEKSNAGYTLTGTKAFISGGDFSDLYLVMSRTGEDGPKGISCIAVPADVDGISFGALEDKMGWRSQPTAQVQLDGAQVPADHLLGEEGKGFSYAMQGLDGGRLNISACSLGAAQTALNAALSYTRERKAFGKSLDQFQVQQFKLAEMEIELQAARTYLRQAAWKLDSGAPDATKFCAMAKKFVTEAGSKICQTALQIHGGYGYLKDYGIEKLVRDVRVHEILEGTSDVMCLITSRALLKERDLG